MKNKTYIKQNIYPNIFRVLFFVCLSIGLLLPSNTYAQKKLKNRKDSVAFDLNQQKFNDTFIQANLLKNKKDYYEALDLYYDCIKLLPKNSVPYYEIAQIYLKKYKRSESEKAIKKAIKLNPYQADYYYFQAELYKSWKKYNEQIQTLETLAKILPDDLELQYKIAEVYTSNRQFSNALSILDKLESKYGVNERILEEKIINYSSSYDLKLTEKELLRIIELFPQVSKNKYVLAELYFNLQEYDKAFQIYSNLEQNEENTSKALIAIGEIYKKQEKFDSLRIQIEKIFASPFVNPSVKKEAYDNLVLGSPSSSSIYKERFALAQELLNFYPEDVNLHEIVADYYYKIDSLQIQSLPHYYYSLEHNNADIQTYKRIISLEQNAEKWDSVISVGKKVIEAYPYYKKAYLDVAEAYINTERYLEADTFLLDGSDLVFRKNVKAQFNSLLAFSTYKQKNAKQALEYLKIAQSYDTTEYVCRQVFAYINSYENTNLQKAIESVNSCIIDDSTDVTNYLILARIYFNTNKYSEAQEELQKVITEKPSADAYELLGDILYKKGNINEAQNAWRKVVDFGSIIDIQRKELLLQKK